jgi:hypothetical protein
MKKALISVLSVLAIISVFSQNGYWQQKVDYTIEATLDTSKKMLKGKEKLVYTNNSPDDLKELYFHMYWNAFKLGSHAMKHAMESGEKEAISVVSKLTKEDEGYIKMNSVKVNGQTVTPAIMESIALIKLTSPLKAGSSATIEIEFESLIPSCINRSGKNNTAGTDFTFTQWYPKICRYDKQGWHNDQYLGREFAGTFGSFNVALTCNKEFVVAGTGILQNKKYTETSWESTTGNADDKGNMTTWKFTADNVHDFAWAAEQEWKHASTKIDDIEFHYFWHNTDEYKDAWSTLRMFWADAYAICKKEFGVYPYSQFSFIQAGEGYMEYPMCTMLEGGRDDFFGTACHEFMHNFFYGIYGTDENLNHWMDEGLTTYAESRLSVVVTRDNENPAQDAGYMYKMIRLMYPEEPVSTHANFFSSDYAYYNCAYYKGQMFAELIRYMIGDDIMRDGFARYYQNWKFKHPEPNDFVKTFEDVSGMELTWFQNYWLNTTKPIDFSVDSALVDKGGELLIQLGNKGVPLPIELMIEMKDGSKKYFYIPIDLTGNSKTNFLRATTALPYWSAAEKTYRVVVNGVKQKNVTKITLDPDGFIPDTNPDNNVLKVAN